MKTKILFLYGPLGGGGAERVLIDLLNNLDYTKYEVDLCLIVNQGVLLHEIPKEVTIISLWNDYSLYYKIAFRMSVWFSNSFMFTRILKKKITEEYDVEVSFLEGMPLKLHGLLNTKAKKISWVHCDLYNFHCTKKQFEKNEELAAYNKMDRVVCVSNDAKLAFQKRFPTCSTEITVIYNPIDRKKIELMAKDPCIKSAVFNIVCVGRLTLQKKMDRVVRLASRLKEEHYQVHFQIIGEGELREDLLAQIADFNVSDYVTLFGYVANPFPHMKNADLLLLSSGFEGFGLVVCEAMVLGVPVVSTKTAGPIEIIDENRYGLLCDHDDESMYEAVKKMINDEALRNHYQKVGYTRAQDFSVENTIKQFEGLL
jgi:glycosyltransferase involved in cell wall biosynthesis